nr:unnamed protein product [Callosobruchus analis]
MKEMTRGQVNVKLEAGTVMAVNSEYTPNKQYKEKALYWYNAEMQPLSFQWHELAAKNLSDYISDHTNGRIQNLVKASDIVDDTPLLVASYMDTSVKWGNRFDADATLIETFYGIKNKTRIIYAMKGIFYANVSHDNHLQAKILSLPLQGGNLTMTFVLPDKRDGIDALLPKLADNLEVLWKPERNNYKYVPTYVLLPKFKINNHLDGGKILRKMGIHRLFEPNAELEKIAYGPGLHLSQIKQKSVLSVNEDGVNSAAGTGESLELLNLVSQ